jgi:hypothetical protein
MVPHIMEHGQDGYKMKIEEKDIEYLINQRIKALNGKKQILLENKSIDEDTKEDIDRKIKALTNLNYFDIIRKEEK